MVLKLLLYFFIIFFSIITYATPSPIGIELNKSTISDVIETYNIIKKEKNYWDGDNYFLDTKDIKLQNLSQALVICNDYGIIQAIVLIINENAFQEFYDLLLDKYILSDNTISNVGNRNATFKDNDSFIILDVPHLSANMKIVYITDSFYKKLIGKIYEEKKKRREELL